MKSRFRRAPLLLLAALALALASCASEDADRPRGPMDSTSALPWNRPLPGERTGPMGALPFQSH